jgi:small-conductance mechanosensitive channel
MAAGLPGFGLGGIFFIASALLAPLIELPRTLRGESSRERWRVIVRNLAFALAMVAVVSAVLGFGSVALAAPAFTIGLLVVILSLAKGAELIARARPRVQTPSARIRPRSMDPAEERA